MKKLSRRSFIEFSTLGAVALGGGLVLQKGVLLEKAARKLMPEPSPTGNFIHWSFGGQPFTSPVMASSVDFRFNFIPAAERREYGFREEVFRACKELDKKRNGATVALCYSGGVDSDVVALAMSQLGIPYELYFVDFWGGNQNTYNEWVKPGAAKLGKQLHVVSLDRKDFIRDAHEDFQITGCESPTYLGMQQLFAKIPADQYIVTGDGDLDRRGQLFSHLGYKYPLNDSASGSAISFSISSVAHDIWAQAKGRKGEFYFFRSTPGLIAATLTSPKFKAEYPFSDVKSLVLSEFPEVKQRQKTTNWEGNVANRDNRRVRQVLERFARSSEHMTFWRRLTGTVVRADDIFLKG